MFGNNQQIYLAQQEQQYHLARYQQEQRMRLQQQQQYPSRLQYQGSHRYYDNSPTQQQQQSLQQSQSQSQQGPTAATQHITSQNEQQQSSQQSQQQNRSNNFNPQNNNSFQNQRGKQHRDYNNRERNGTHHRKNHRQNNNNNNNNNQQQQQQQHQNGSISGNNNNNNSNGNGKKSINNNGNNHHNGNSNSSGGNNNGRMVQTKSEMISYNDRKNSMNGRSNSNESQHKSLSSTTPPSSVKSLSPQKSLNHVIHSLENTRKDELLRLSTKSTSTSTISSLATNNNNNTITVESLTDDSISTSSGNSLRGLMTGAGDGAIVKASGIATKIDTSSKERSINSWINANNHFSGINNGLSTSADQLNTRANDYNNTNQQRKRPPSANTLPLRGDLESSLSYDYYLTRIYQCDTRIEPPNLKCNSQWDLASKQIWERYTLFQQTQITFRNKILAWQELYEFIKGFQFFQNRSFPSWGLFLVGSTITGFGLDSSDIDMCLVMNSTSHLDPRSEAMVTLSALKTYLINIGSPFQNFSLINAKVPILRFRDVTNTIEIDLNYNNCIGVRNTHLLYCYAQIDWRLRPLVIMVKLWAQFHNINDARNGTISSYSLVLMVIFFLQFAAKPKVLPCLHTLYPEKFQINHDITRIDMMERLDSIDFKSENVKPIGELFLRFLDYYSNFDYTKYAISVRTGSLLLIEDCRVVRTLKNEPSHWQTLCIEEPFDLTNTARSTYDWDVFKKIKNVFYKSLQKLNQTKNVESLFQEPFFVHNMPSTHHTYVQQLHVLQEVNYYMQGNVQQPSSLNPPILSPAANKSPAEITS